MRAARTGFLALLLLLGAPGCARVSGNPAPATKPEAPAGLPDPVSPGCLALLPGNRVLVGDSGVSSFWTLGPDLAVRAPLPGGDGRPTEPEGMAVRPDGKVYVTDLLRRDLTLLDPATGAREPVSGPERGQGPPFDTPQDVALAPDGSLWVTDPGRPGLWRVDPTSGDRTVVEGEGPRWSEPFACEFSPDGTLYVTDLRLSAVVRVDPSTLERTVVASERRGAGPKLDSPTALLPLPAGDLLVADVSLHALFSVRPDTGDRTLVSGPSRGGGPAMREPMSLALEGPNQVLVGDAGLGAVVRVDLVTGDRSASVEGPATSEVSEVEALCSSPAGEVWCLLDHGRELVQLAPGPPRPVEARVDLLEPLVVASAGGSLVLADRRDYTFLVLDPERGTGRPVPGLVCRHAPAAVGLPDGRLAYFDGLERTLYEVDPRTGARRVVSGPDHPGPEVRMPVQMALQGEDLFLCDETSATIVSVNRATGRRALVSGAGRGRGTAFLYPDGLGVLPGGDLCVADQGQKRLVRVRPRTGDRTPLFSRTAEPDLPSPGPLVVLPEGSVVVLDQVRGPVRVHLRTGEATLLDTESLPLVKDRSDA